MFLENINFTILAFFICPIHFHSKCHTVTFYTMEISQNNFSNQHYATNTTESLIWKLTPSANPYLPRPHLPPHSYDPQMGINE